MANQIPRGKNGRFTLRNCAMKNFTLRSIRL